ncbi:MAG TPA: helix-turn-helix transcriptional regulator [Acetobacteraceae bacterium]
MLDELEEAQDLAAVRVGRAHEAQMGYESARKNYLTADESRRLLDGQHPVKIWREKRGLSQRELAEASGVGSGYIGDIEACRKPGSVDALRRFAKVLRTEIDWLVPTSPSQG